MFAPKATSYGERAKPSVSCGPAALRVQRIGRTTEAISMRKSWKPSECDQTSSLYHLVGDFVSEDHLFIDLIINHRVRSLDPRSAWRYWPRSIAPQSRINTVGPLLARFFGVSPVTAVDVKTVYLGVSGGRIIGVDAVDNDQEIL